MSSFVTRKVPWIFWWQHTIWFLFVIGSMVDGSLRHCLRSRKRWNLVKVIFQKYVKLKRKHDNTLYNGTVKSNALVLHSTVSLYEHIMDRTYHMFFIVAIGAVGSFRHRFSTPQCSSTLKIRRTNITCQTLIHLQVAATNSSAMITYHFASSVASLTDN